MQPQLVNKEQTYSIGQWMVDNFDVAFGSITSSWLVEHTQDDTHADITCWSVTVNAGVQNPNTGQNSTGNITGGGVLTMNGINQHRVGGNLVVNEAGSTLASTDNAVNLGNVGSIIPNDGRTGPGMSFLLGTSKRIDVVLYNDGGPNQYGLRWMDLVTNETPLELSHDPIGGSYWLGPGKVTGGAVEVDLGTGYYGGVLGQWTNLYMSGKATIGGAVSAASYNGVIQATTAYGPFNDALTHTLGVVANMWGVASVINGNGAGYSHIPFFANAGAGIGWHFTVLDPDTGWVINGNGISFSFTDGSGVNAYTFEINGGSGAIDITRTAGTAPYTVKVVTNIEV